MTGTPQNQQQQGPAAAPQTGKRAALSPNDAAAKITSLLSTNPGDADKGKKQPQGQAQAQKKTDTQQQANIKKKAAVDGNDAPAKGKKSDPLAENTGEDEDATETTEETEEGAEGATGAEDQTEDDGTEEGDQEGDAGDDAASSENADEQDPETLHSIVIDGKESKVTYKELISGYQRQADYTRKMQTLAKERKDVEAVKEQVKDLPNVQKAYQEGAATFSKNAQLVMLALEQRFMPKAPDQALIDKDPAAYLKAKELHQEALHFRAGLTQELQGLEAKAKEEAKKQVFQGRQKLFETVPELKDTVHRQELSAYARAHGFTDEQIQNEPSPILFGWARKAMLYDKIMEQKAKLSPDKSKPKVVKQSKASEGHKAIQVRQRTAAIDNHRNEKSVDSAARALAGIGLK